MFIDATTVPLVVKRIATSPIKRRRAATRGASIS
jgi:hypothetical protein